MHWLGTLLLIGFIGLGAMIVMSIRARPTLIEILGLALPLGSGVLTFAVFLISWIGIPVTATVVAFIWFVLTVGLGLAVRRRTPLHSDQAQAGWSLTVYACVGVLLFVLGSAVFLGVGRAYSSYDAAAMWAIKGYGIVIEQSVQTAQTWGNIGPSYPLNLPLQIGIFELLSGDELPASKLIFPVYLASFLLVAIWFWSRNGVSVLTGVAGALFLATIQLVYLHATIGYANLPLSVYVVSGICWGLEGLFKDERDARWIAGLLLAIGIWTRPDGLVYAVVVSLGFFITWSILRDPRQIPGEWLLPMLGYSAAWFAFSGSRVQEGHMGTAVAGSLEQLASGHLNLLELYMIPRLFAERALAPDNMGYFVHATIIFGCLGLLRNKFWRDDELTTMGVLTILLTLVPIGLFYIQSFTWDQSFRELLVRSFDRAFLPATFMIVVFLIQVAAGRSAGSVPPPQAVAA